MPFHHRAIRTTHPRGCRGGFRFPPGKVKAGTQHPFNEPRRTFAVHNAAIIHLDANDSTIPSTKSSGSRQKIIFTICTPFAAHPVDFDLRLTYNSHREAIVFLHFFPQSHQSPADRRNGRSGSDRAGGEKCPVTAFQSERLGSVSVVTGFFRGPSHSVQCCQPHKVVAALLKYNQYGGSVRQASCRTAELNDEWFAVIFFQEHHHFLSCPIRITTSTIPKESLQSPFPVLTTPLRNARLRSVAFQRRLR